MINETLARRLRTRTVLGPPGSGLRADWSDINQAWLVRPYHPAWSGEVQLAAPVAHIWHGTRRDIIARLIGGAA